MLNMNMYVNVATFSRRLNFLLRNGEGNTIRPHCLIGYDISGVWLTFLQVGLNF